MIKVTLRRGQFYGHIKGYSDHVLAEYEVITNHLIHMGFTQEEISRAAAAGVEIALDHMHEKEAKNG